MSASTIGDAMLEIIRCTDCLGPISWQPAPQWYSSLNCPHCGKNFEKRGEVPDFAPHIPADPGSGFAQKMMNTRFFAGLYETPIWRPLLASLGAGEPATAEVERVLAYLKEPDYPAVLDLACGTGHYARAISQRHPGAQIYAMDISPGMLQAGRERAEAEGFGQLRFMGADIYQLPVADGAVDLVNCGGALHLFTDLGPIWAEIARVLKPGGRFTAMTIPLLPGPLRRVQKAMMGQGRATFFDPEIVAAELRVAGFEAFEYRIKRAVILFTAVKRPAMGPE